MNMGKFPSPTAAQKEVGGGYYSIKKMLQEMEYNFKMSPVENSPTQENIKQIKGDDAPSQEIAMESSGSGSQENSNGQITIDQNLHEDHWLEPGSNSDKNTDTRNNSITRDDTHNIATESDQKLEQNPRDDHFVLKDSGSKAEKQPDEIRNIKRDKGDEENELREEASLWGNLKSLANGFINMWKK